EQSAILHARVLLELGHKTRLYSNFAADTVNRRLLLMPNIKALRWLWSWLYFPLLATFQRAGLLNPHSREDQIILTLTKWLHRTPVVWKDPGDLVHQIWLERPGFFGGLNQKLLIAALKKADAVYMLNDEDRNTVLERLKYLGHEVDGSKLKVIPSDILFDDYDLDAAPPKKTDKLVVGTVSR